MKSILLLFIMLFIISGCGKSYKNDSGRDNKKDMVNSIEQDALQGDTQMKVTMISKHDTYPISTKKVGIMITNNTSVEYQTGDAYIVEQFDGSLWKKVSLEFAYHDALITLLPQEARDFDIYLYPEQYDYEPGKYRIRKEVWSKDQKFEVTCEFNLE